MRASCPSALRAAHALLLQVGGSRGQYLKPSSTAKMVRNANGRMVLTDVPDKIRTSHNAWCQHRGCGADSAWIAVIGMEAARNGTVNGVGVDERSGGLR